MTWAEYLFYLAHRIFKRAPHKDSDIDQLSQALGLEFEHAQENIFLLRDQALILTASGSGLDICGKDRKMPRLQGESDDAYRLRLLKAYSYYRSVGTFGSIKKALAGLGYSNVEIYPWYLIDPTKWSQFWVELTLDGVALDTTNWLAIHNTVNRMKPSHERMSALNVSVPARDIGAKADVLEWSGAVSYQTVPCPFPAENLHPSEELYPC